MELRRQISTTTHPIAFQMLDSGTKLGKTGLTPVVTLSKDGGTFGAAAGVVTELTSGWYQLAGNATDRNTLGSLIVHATAAGADPGDTLWEIVTYDPYDTPSAYTGYGSATGAAALASMWTLNGVWVDTVPAYGAVAEIVGTRPDLTQVLAWLDNVTGMVNVALNGAGFVTPVTQVTAVQAIDMLVNSIAADLCHAANSSGRFFTEHIIERGLSPMVIVNQQIGNWVAEWAEGFARLGVPRLTTVNPVSPSFSGAGIKQL